MKILLAVGFLVLVLVMFKGNVKEGYADSEINTDIGKFNSVKSNASNDTKNSAIKNMKINWATHDMIKPIIDKYNGSNAIPQKKVTYDLTVNQAVDKLNYRKSHN